jgi:hypothetical protein
MFDKNSAIEAFSAAFGNNVKRLEAYCHDVGYEGDVMALADLIRQIQEQVFGEIYRRSENQPLNGEEITSISREYVAAHEPWINDVGLNGLLQWVGWMAWHEGCMKIPQELQELRKPKPWWQVW